MSDIVKAVRGELKSNSDKKVRESGERFFKEEIILYGVKTAVVEKIAKRYFKEIKTRGKREVFRLCEELLKSGYMEEAGVAFEWAYLLHKDYEAGDFPLFERWVKTYVSNWAECDTLCTHAIGTFVEMYPSFIKKLTMWTGSDNRWARRAAAVTLILPARKGMFLKDVFAIAGRLLTDKDDLVQKGYGWLLKVASMKHRKEVFDYVIKHKQAMPRTALRYAIEKMPAHLKAKAMSR